MEIDKNRQPSRLLGCLWINYYSKKLIPSLKMPFDAILVANKTQNWLRVMDEVGTYFLASPLKIH